MLLQVGWSTSGSMIHDRVELSHDESLSGISWPLHHMPKRLSSHGSSTRSQIIEPEEDPPRCLPMMYDIFVSPELSSVRDYVIAHSVRSMYVVHSMYVVFCKIDHCIHTHWCIVMGLGHNDPWIESYMWPQQTWGQRSSRGQWPLVQVFGKKESVYPHTLMYFQI